MLERTLTLSSDPLKFFKNTKISELLRESDISVKNNKKKDDFMHAEKQTDKLTVFRCDRSTIRQLQQM